MAGSYTEPQDVTEAVLAHPDAHPIKDHDLIVFAQGRHVKVRTHEAPWSGPDEPYYVATYALADETGKARLRQDGRPAVYGGVNKAERFGVNREGEHHLIFAGEAPVSEPGHAPQEEHDYAELAARARLRTAETVARLDRAREEVGRLGRVKRNDTVTDVPATATKMLEAPK